MDIFICKIYFQKRFWKIYFLKNICFNIFLKRIFDTNICLAYDGKAHALNGYIRKTCTLVLFTNSIVLDWVFRVSTCALFVSLSLYHLDALSRTFSWVVIEGEKNTRRRGGGGVELCFLFLRLLLLKPLFRSR